MGGRLIHGIDLYTGKYGIDWFATIYGVQKQNPTDEMQKSQRLHIKADHQWY